VPTGTVLRYERNSGYGFIRKEDGEEIFVHHTGLADREFLVAGQEVRFSIEPSERGPRAVKVTVTRDVSLKRQRHLDWRGRRGKAPRPGDLPRPAQGSGQETPTGEDETSTVRWPDNRSS
jgi:CspA family cold shock protein